MQSKSLAELQARFPEAKWREKFVLFCDLVDMQSGIA
jgi:hypothetical protein